MENILIEYIRKMAAVNRVEKPVKKVRHLKRGAGKKFLVTTATVATAGILITGCGKKDKDEDNVASSSDAQNGAEVTSEIDEVTDSPIVYEDDDMLITTEFPLPICLSENTYTLKVPGEGSGNIKSCEVEKKEEGRYEIRFKTFSFTAVYDEKNDEYVVEDFFGIDGNRVRASVRKNNDGTYTVKALGYTVTAVCDEKSEKVSISAKEEIKIYLDYDKKAVVDAKSEEYVADYLNDEPYDNEAGTEVADNDAADENNTSSNTTSGNGNNTSGNTTSGSSHGNNGSGGNNSGNTGNGSGNTTSSSSSGNNSSSGNTTSSSGNNNSNTTSNNNNSNTTSSDPNAGKTWVEPVYDWVWHGTGNKVAVESPVYETEYHVICRCGADLGVGEEACERWAATHSSCRGYDNIPYDVQVGTTTEYVDEGEWVYEEVIPGHWE